MSHVLILTLGPIQDFIETARRTRDLWFGSWLLSELSKATAEAIARVVGIEALVFPGIADIPTGTSWSRRASRSPPRQALGGASRAGLVDGGDERWTVVTQDFLV